MKIQPIDVDKIRGKIETFTCDGCDDCKMGSGGFFDNCLKDKIAKDYTIKSLKTIAEKVNEIIMILNKD